MLLPAIAMMLMSLGCSLHVQRSDVPGSYIAEKAGKRFELAINTDGTYKQEVRSDSATAPMIASGHWTYGNHHGSSISFDDAFLDFQAGFEPGYARVAPGGAVMPIDEVLGRIYIGSDKGTRYKRQ